jgi:hypothetical protein
MPYFHVGEKVPLALATSWEKYKSSKLSEWLAVEVATAYTEFAFDALEGPVVFEEIFELFYEGIEEIYSPEEIFSEHFDAHN